MIYQTKTCTKCGYKIQNRQVRDEKIQIASPFVKCINCGTILIDNTKKEYIMGNKVYYAWYLISNSLGFGFLFGLLILGAFMTMFENFNIFIALPISFGISCGGMFIYLYNDFCEKRNHSIERTLDLKYLKLLLDYNLINKIQYENFIEEYELKEDNVIEKNEKSVHIACKICKRITLLNEYSICDECNNKVLKRIEEKKANGKIINCKICGKEIYYNEYGTCEECHKKIINRLENKANISKNETKSIQEEVYEIIFKSFNKDDIKEIKILTYSLIEEEQIKEKTTLFLKIIEMQNLLYKEVKDSKKLDLPANNLTNLIYLKLYLDAILLIDNDMADFMTVSTLCRMSGKIEEKLTNYLKVMVEINMLIEDNIIYLFKNITNIDKEYYMIVSNKISNLLLEYNDDGTDWNKIFDIPSI